MVNSFLDALFPHRCYLCEQLSHSTLPLCNSCSLNLALNLNYCSHCALPLPAVPSANCMKICSICQLTPPPFSRVIAPWVYDEHIAFLVHKWKFQGEKQLTALLANLWSSQRSISQPIDLIIPVPLHWRKLWRRGFNQAELLARNIHSLHPLLHNTKVDVGQVIRTRATESQVGLNASERGDNLSAVFRSRKTCVGMRIAIVDDVMTTGSTVTALSECLLNAGALSVEVWCLARTPAPPQ